MIRSAASILPSDHTPADAYKNTILHRVTTADRTKNHVKKSITLNSNDLMSKGQVEDVPSYAYIQLVYVKTGADRNKKMKTANPIIW